TAPAARRPATARDRGTGKGLAIVRRTPFSRIMTSDRMSREVVFRKMLVAVSAGVLVAWVVSIERMRGMDAGPGTDLGALGWFVGIWVTMTAAVMLPSAAP